MIVQNLRRLITLNNILLAADLIDPISDCMVMSLPSSYTPSVLQHFTVSVRTFSYGDDEERARHVSEIGAEMSHLERMTNDLARLSIDQIDPLGPQN